MCGDLTDVLNRGRVTRKICGLCVLGTAREGVFPELGLLRQREAFQVADVISRESQGEQLTALPGEQHEQV